ncbi:MAG: hypothetical protein HYX51_06895 [Chloroflexi bacterium]|nr:hypothetical protein [Chloroflexota bacterium]
MIGGVVNIGTNNGAQVGAQVNGGLLSLPLAGTLGGLVNIGTNNGFQSGYVQNGGLVFIHH